MEKIFSLPKFQDPERQRRANILVATEIAALVMTVMIVLISVIMTPERSEVILQGIVGIALFLGSLYLIKLKKLELSAWVIVIVGWLIMTLDLAFISGIRGVNVLGQVMIIIIAGLAINGKAGLLVTLISLLANFLVFQLESQGIMAAPNPLPTGFIRWFIQGMYAFLAAIYIWRADTTISEAIKTSQNTADRYRTLFSHTNDGVIVFDPDWTISMANPMITSLLGYNEEELINYGLIPRLITDDTDWIQEIQNLVLSGKDIPDYEKVLKRRDGTKIPVEISTTAVLDAGGTPKHIQVVIRDITERIAYESQLVYQAEHDHLTDLPNRKYLENHFLKDNNSEGEGDEQISVLYVDLDDFKQINDAYGHAIGDQLLIEVGARLQTSIREDDTVARIGGDEFIIILENVSDREIVSGIADKLLKRIADPYRIEDQKLTITACIGIMITPKKTLADIADMIISDNAMYRAKMEGKNSYRFIESEPEVTSS